MKSKLPLVRRARRLARRGAGGLVKKFAPKFSSLADRNARRVVVLGLTRRLIHAILVREARGAGDMNGDYDGISTYKRGDLVNVIESSYGTLAGCRPYLVGAIVMRRSERLPTLCSVYHKGKIWRNIHQDEMEPCRPQEETN